MLEIAICDDQLITAEYHEKKIKSILADLKTEARLTLFIDSARLLADIYNGKKWDVYFLDIDMPIVDGLNLGQKIREQDKNAYLIYISIHKEQVYESLKNRPFRFIPKDDFDSQIFPCIQDLVGDLKTDSSDYIIIESGSSIYRFKTDEVMYVQSFDKYVSLTLADHSTSPSIRYKITNLEKDLEEKGFIRIHKSYLVNYRYINKILPDSVILDDHSSLPVSRMRLDQIKSSFRRLVL